MGAPSISNSRERFPAPCRIAGRRYPIQIKYQYGPIPFRSNTREVLSFKSEIIGGAHPVRPNTKDRLLLQNKYQRGVIRRSRIPRKGYPFQIKYHKGAAAALSVRSDIPGRGPPSRPNPWAGKSPPWRIPRKCYPSGG